jgi:Flp pilus assembly protein TadG
MSRQQPLSEQTAEWGVVTVFVLLTIVGLLMGAGLVFDGGRILTARRDVDDVARAAARAGVQAVDPRSQTGTDLDHAEAELDATTYLTANGYSGDVTVVGSTVTVTVRRSVDMAILPFGPRTVTGTASARPFTDLAP